MTTAAEACLVQGVERMSLTARSASRVWKVARTIADLGGEEALDAPHIAEALCFRPVSPD
jgi:magnesium chelatase family protein